MASANASYSAAPKENYFILLKNGKELESPSHFPFTTPTQALANAIIEEFVEQGEKPDLRKMPLTQLALTAVDISKPKRNEIIEALIRYSQIELICQRAETPPSLVTEQTKAWQPYLEWCRERFGADLRTGCGVVPFEQNPKAIAALRTHIETLDAYVLTGLSEACTILGSLVLALALTEDHICATEAFAAAEFESLWQMKTWGEDPATQSRLASIERDLAICEKWFSLIRENRF